jgi:CBS domain-containing protein
MFHDVSGRPGLSEMTVDKAMHPGVFTCPPETPLQDVALMMARYRIHAVVVYSDDDESDEPPGMWGVVSDVDLIAAAAVDDVAGRTAGGTAKSPLVTIAPRQTLQRAAELMKQHSATHLVVASPSSERPLGIVSTLDVARAIASEPAYVSL